MKKPREDPQTQTYLPQTYLRTHPPIQMRGRHFGIKSWIHDNSWGLGSWNLDFFVADTLIFTLLCQSVCQFFGPSVSHLFLGVSGPCHSILRFCASLPYSSLFFANGFTYPFFLFFLFFFLVSFFFLFFLVFLFCFFCFVLLLFIFYANIFIAIWLPKWIHTI